MDARCRMLQLVHNLAVARPQINIKYLLIAYHRLGNIGCWSHELYIVYQTSKSLQI